MLKGPIAKATIRTSFVLGLRFVVQGCTLLLVARMLGSEQFGAFAGIASVAMLLGALSAFGMHLVLLAEMSKDPTRREKVLAYALPTTLLFGSSLLACFLVISMWGLGSVGVPFLVLLLIGMTETILQPLFAFLSIEYHALGRTAHAQLLQMPPLFFRLLTAFVVLIFQPSEPLTYYAWGYVAAPLFALIVGIVNLPVYWPALRQWRLPQRQELAHAFSYAAISITKTAPSELDKALAIKLLPLDLVGVYTAGARVIGAISLPVTAMILAALPRLFRHEKTPPNRLLRWMLLSALGYGLLIASILWLIAPFFKDLFGDNYHGVEDVIRWLCIAVPGMSLRYVLANILVTLGKSWIRIGYEVIGLSILTIMSIVLSHKYGLHGMIFAVAFFEWFMVVLGGLYIMHTTRLS